MVGFNKMDHDDKIRLLRMMAIDDFGVGTIASKLISTAMTHGPAIFKKAQ
jgi:hypothetical protein